MTTVADFIHLAPKGYEDVWEQILTSRIVHRLSNNEIQDLIQIPFCNIQYHLSRAGVPPLTKTEVYAARKRRYKALHGIDHHMHDPKRSIKAPEQNLAPIPFEDSYPRINHPWYVYILFRSDPSEDDYNTPFYVGQSHVPTRLQNHLSEARRGSKTANPYRNHTIRQHITIGILPSYKIIPCETEQEALDVERELIQQYGRFQEGGILTNISAGGVNVTGVNDIPIDQYDVATKQKIATWPSIITARTALGLGSSIGECIKKRYKTCGGFAWVRAGEEVDWVFVLSPLAQPPRRRIKQYDKAFNLLNEFESSQAAAVHINIPNRTASSVGNDIVAVCRKANKSAFGYHWSWADEELDTEWLTPPPEPIVEKYTLDGNLVGCFVGLKEAAKSVGVNHTTNIRNVCEGKYSQSKGFVWKYAQ